MVMPRRTVACAVVLVLTAIGSASGQDSLTSPIVLPGSVNASFGTVGPLEPGNVLASATFEQGFTAWRRGPMFVVGFIDITLRADALGYGWNNTVPYLTGGKLVLAGARGVLQAVAGVAGDFRRGHASDLTRAVYMSYWSAWRQPTSRVELPGTMWATSGLVTASEPGNWITAAHVDQGIAVWRRSSAAIMPFAGATLSTDTDAHSWNNRGLIDAGLKVSTRLRGAAMDVGVAHRVTRAWQNGETGSAPVAFVNVWLGWMPRVTP